jgi:hypothetical protein
LVLVDLGKEDNNPSRPPDKLKRSFLEFKTDLMKIMVYLKGQNGDGVKRF